MNKDKLNLMFDLLKILESKGEEIQGMFGSCEFLDKEISMLWEIIEIELGVEPCDESSDILASFGCGELSQMKAIGKLLKLK